MLDVSNTPVPEELFATTYVYCTRFGIGSTRKEGFSSVIRGKKSSLCPIVCPNATYAFNAMNRFMFSFCSR